MPFAGYTYEPHGQPVIVRHGPPGREYTAVAVHPFLRYAAFPAFMRFRSRRAERGAFETEISIPAK
ncbi:MAG TPA: hypothetical protein DEB39_14145 [Planctomycetaceae bacterium]|nr:hypothetical protein [Planctomycetaceae bacterium]